MATSVMDTLELAEQFVEAGFEENKAKILAAKFGELANERLVTKEDLRNELEKQDLRLTIKIAMIVTAVVGFFAIMERFF